jgi:leucyl/phenylalanyl-tRNA--protein transferase
VWDARDRLVGGIYGVTLGGAFMGESMFHRETDASKVALVFLAERLRAAGFTLFDAQVPTPHLASLGAVEVSRDRFLTELDAALRVRPDRTWQRAGAEAGPPS